MYLKISKILFDESFDIYVSDKDLNLIVKNRFGESDIVDIDIDNWYYLDNINFEIKRIETIDGDIWERSKYGGFFRLT
jgi:hypothetical protein